MHLFKNCVIEQLDPFQLNYKAFKKDFNSAIEIFRLEIFNIFYIFEEVNYSLRPILFYLHFSIISPFIWFIWFVIRKISLSSKSGTFVILEFIYDPEKLLNYL